MKVFYWPQAKANALYKSGRLIAVAPDIESARSTVREKAKTGYLGYLDMSEAPYNEDDGEDRADKLKILEADLEKEPEVHDLPFALLINGSE